MASKIIILSGDGRGIARVYEMVNKTRIEVDCVVKDNEKKIAVIINGQIFTRDYPSRQLAVDLPACKVDEAQVLVYNGNKCVLSGDSRGKCNIAKAMYDIISHTKSEQLKQNVSVSAADDDDSEEIGLGKAVDLAEIAKRFDEKKENDVNNASVENSEPVLPNRYENTSEITVCETTNDDNTGTEAAINEADDIVNEEYADNVCRKEETNCDICNVMLSEKDDITAGDTKGTEPFYMRISHKLEEIFDIYSHDTVLEELVYDSSWVRIPYEDDSYYVVGIIKDDGAPIFICYGLPADCMSRPCHEIENMCEWLPLDKNDISGKGYWLVYQDAMTGENIY